MADAIRFLAGEPIPRFRQLAERITEAARDGDLTAFLDLDRQFHLGLIELLGDRRLLTMVGQLRDQARMSPSGSCSDATAASSAPSSPGASSTPAVPAIIPEVAGTAHLTRHNTLVLHPDDELPTGRLLPRPARAERGTPDGSVHIGQSWFPPVRFRPPPLPRPSDAAT